MARLAQSQSDYCAKIGHLVHSSRYAFQGGENLAQGGSYFSPRSIVNCWLRSKAGHRAYLLSSRVKKAGVGIAKSRGKTYVAWAFSGVEPPSYPDCPYYKKSSKNSSRATKKYTRKEKNDTSIVIVIILVVIAVILLKIFGII